jgi:pimeloyl-ACP methyl ester carboxylesterase
MEESFERYIVKTNGGDIEVFKIQHENFESRPIILIPGWGESFDSIKEFAFKLSESLSKTVCVPDYANLDLYSSDFKCQEHGDMNLPATEKLRAKAIHDFILSNPELFNEGFVLIAHSEGAITATFLAYLHKDKNISPLILIAPAGIVQKSFWQLIKDFNHYFFLRMFEAIKTNNRTAKKYYLSSLIYIIKNPLQLFRDAKGISQSNIVPLLNNLSKDGLRVELILQNHDTLFIKEEVNKSNLSASIHEIDGSHAQVHIEPEEVIELIKSIIYE